MRHLIDPFDFSLEETHRVLETAARIEADPAAYQDVASRKRLATLFYEPSTRTRLSHEAAMMNLGGSVMGFPSANVSSVSKGETAEDTIRMIGCYADIAAMRHPIAGTPAAAAEVSRIPVINAGDGGNNHPTQTLLDLYTIQKRMGRLDHLTIGFCGDLDILYMTRIQQERFASQEEYLRFKGVYILDAEKMKHAKEHMAVLHPFPRVDEIKTDVDSDPRAAYFEQAQNGVYTRMAVIMALLNLEDPKTGEQILL